MFRQKSCWCRYFLVVLVGVLMGCDENGNLLLFKEFQNQPKVEVQNQPKANAKNQPKAVAQSQPQAKAENQPKAETQSQPQVVAQSQPKVEVQSQPQVEVQNQPNVESQNQPKAELENQGQPKVEVQSQPQIEVPKQPQAVEPNQPDVEVQSQPKVEVPRKIAGPDLPPQRPPVKPEEVEIPVPIEGEAASNLKLIAAPEFDGCYIKTKQGYIEVPVTAFHTTKIQLVGMMLYALWDAPTMYYTMDYHGVSCTLADFEGIYIQGKYNFDYLSFHPLMKRRLQQTESFFDNTGPATEAAPFYIPGKQMPIRTRAENLAVFFKPQVELKSGYYVAWIGKDFWIIALH